MTARACSICGGSLAHVHPNRHTCGDECRAEQLRRQWQAYRERMRARSQMPALTEKFCSGCRRTLPRDAFGPNRSHASGLQAQCNECRRELRRRPDQREKERLRQRVRYLLRCEEVRRRLRMRYLFDLEYRARVNAANHARYHSDPKGVYRRARERLALRQEWEAQDARRCFCGRALPGGDGEEGQWFCRPACKVKCSRFVCGLSKEARG